MIAGVDESVEREGVVLGGCGFLFNERAEDTAFDIVEFVQTVVHGVE